MAKYGLSTSDANVKKLYDEKLFRDIIKEPYFARFMEDDSNGIVHVKTQLDGKKGDQVYFPLRMRLTGSGVTGNAQLEGNEERLTDYQDSVSLERYRHAVRDDGDLTRQRAVFDVDEEAELAIRDWGTEKIDDLCFDAVQASPTRIVYPNGSGGTFSWSSTASVAAADMHASGSLLTLDFISQLKTYAKTGNDRGFIPLKPIKIKGKDYYVLLVHPDALTDLKLNSNYQQAAREALERGDENPIFSGAVAMYDNIILHEHENMNKATDGGGGSVAYSTGVLMGKQALVWAWGKRPKVVYKEFDYDEEHGWAWTMTAAVSKPTFNSEDYGSIGVYTARSQVSDTAETTS